MFIDMIRKRTERFVKKYLLFIYKKGFTPNRITVISFILLLISLFLFFYKYLITGGLFMLLSFLFDAIDGSIARITKSATGFGYFLDKTVDGFRSFSWIILAYNNFVSFELAALVVFFNLLGHSTAHIIKMNKLKNMNIPTLADDLIVFAALTTKVTFFCLLNIILGIVFIIANVFAITLLNRKK